MFGLDSISIEAPKAAVNITPNTFPEAFTACPKEGSIRMLWTERTWNFYRPIFYLNNSGKLVDLVIYNRLLLIAEKEGALFENLGLR